MNLSDLVLYATFGSLEILLDLPSFCLRTSAMLKMPAMSWMEDMFVGRKFALKWLEGRPEVDELQD